MLDGTVQTDNNESPANIYKGMRIVFTQNGDKREWCREWTTSDGRDDERFQLYYYSYLIQKGFCVPSEQ